jgi:hypothetical protein
LSTAKTQYGIKSGTVLETTLRLRLKAKKGNTPQITVDSHPDSNLKLTYIINGDQGGGTDSGELD